ncbi:hypothetical protein BH10ACI4_BH10ACI4_16390 [soil metagenome]
MTEDLKQVLDKLVKVAEFLCQETADLVDDKAMRVGREYVPGVRRRASEIREASQELRLVADRALGKKDLETGGQP